MQQYCGCYSLLLRYMPENVLFVIYSRSNSQPHTRLTRFLTFSTYFIITSIHNLIRGWPRQCKFAYALFCLSIHSLMRGWPWRFPIFCHSTLFQFTASCEADHNRFYIVCNKNISFNSQPHARLTNAGSCGQHGHDPFNSQPHARLTLRPEGLCRLATSFNSQPHARLTVYLISSAGLNYLSIHSLMRGWPKFYDRHDEQWISFNSQPHARLTRFQHHTPASFLSFNSQPHARLTLMKPIRMRRVTPFNSQPHARLTRKKRILFYIQESFNSQPHARLTSIWFDKK